MGKAPSCPAHQLNRTLRERVSDADTFRHEMLALLLAGHETVTAVLTWSICLLLRHPHVLHAVALESKRDAGKEEHGLPLTTAVIRETLRLYPPAWRITRRTAAAAELDGCLLPAGQRVLLLLPGLHRHSAYWQNADCFQPERFMPGAPALSPWSWLPFGAGPRRCIGAELSMLLLPRLLASVVGRYSLLPACPEINSRFDDKVDLAVTLRPHQPVMVYLR